MTMIALAISIVFVADGWLARWEGIVLIGTWVAFTWVVVRAVPGVIPEEPPAVRHRSRLVQVGIILLALGLVGLGATVAVRALIRMAALAGVPEFAIAFFGASIGTSAPEIVVDVMALRRGAVGIAFGDALGSSLVDSTLSIGAGPTVAPAEVTPRLAIVGSVYAFIAVGLVGGVLTARRRHDRWSAIFFVVLYLLAYVVLIRAS